MGFQRKNSVIEIVKMAGGCQKGTPNLRINIATLFKIEIAWHINFTYIRDGHITWIII